MRSHFNRRQSGFTIFEIILGSIIFILVLNFVSSLVRDYVFAIDIERNAVDISSVPTAVQRRSAHDGFGFEPWDENANGAATGLTLSWPEEDFNELLGQYLVARQNPQCGDLTNGWNPFNTAGGPDLGDETAMERTALFPCNKFRNQVLPYNISLSAALSRDVTGAMETFALYINTTDINFGQKDSNDNNFVNFQKLKIALLSSLSDRTNGEPKVFYGLSGALSDIGDDQTFTNAICEERLIAGQRCDIIIYTEYAGLVVGLKKRTDNQDFFFDDITFGESLAAGRQTCAFYEQVAGAWSGSIVDCGIKAGTGDPDVKLVVDSAFASDLFITNETDVGHLCNIYELRDGKLQQRAAPNNLSPCGITREGSIVQLINDQAHVADIFSEDIISTTLLTSETTLFSDVNGQIVLRVFDSTNNLINFSIDNNGNTNIAGILNVRNNANFNQDVNVDGDLRVLNDVTFEMANGSEILLGNNANGIVMSRAGTNEFNIESNATNLNIRNGDNNQGISLSQATDSDLEINIKADDGVLLENGTSLHSSKSTLRDQLFDATNGINNDELKAMSEVVTADMAKYLDDTSSPVQIIGVERVEGEFLQLIKPNCLAFMDDDNYSTPSANPYSYIDSANLGSGESYARLLLIPTFFKTYNSAFGDNQIYAQHASHSSANTWDIYLYLSGEGAFSTGAREDGAGGSLALILCDYSSIDFSRLNF